MIHSLAESPLGPLTIVSHEGRLRAVYWPGHRGAPAPSALGERVEDALPAATRQLAEYFEGTRREFDLPLETVGTPFQRTVWKALEGIGYGRTATYGELASAIGRPGAARAVGAAPGRNPISIVIPSHRRGGAAGSLTGYAGGVECKRFLLRLEGAEAIGPGTPRG